MPKKYTKKDLLAIAFRGVLRSFGIEEDKLKAIVNCLMREVSIRVYIGGE